MTDNELVPRSELCTWSRKLHIYDGVWKHLLPTFHQSAIGREWRFPWDNFRYPVRWWSVQTTLPAGTHTHFLVFFFPLPLSCLFIQLIRFPGSLPSPSSHGERFMFSMTTCPLSPSSNICLWRREEGEKRLLANYREWWGGSDRVRMSSSRISTTAHFTLEMVTCCCFTQKVHVLF